MLADSEDQAFRLNRLELGGDLEHARARVDRRVLVVPCAVINDAGLVGGGAAARAVAVADGAAVGLGEEVERAVAIAAIAHDVNVAGGKSLRVDGQPSEHARSI